MLAIDAHREWGLAKEHPPPDLLLSPPDVNFAELNLDATRLA